MRTKFKNCGPSAESAGILMRRKSSTFTVCPMIITVNVEIFDRCLISFFRPWTQRILNIYALIFCYH